MLERRRDIEPWGRPWPHWGRLFNDLLDWNLTGDWGRWGFARGPSIDLYETEDAVVVEAEVPGYSPEDIVVQVGPHGLHLRGRRTREENVQRDDYYLRERQFGEFSRTVSFPTPVQADKAKAAFRDGVLKITAPKRLREGEGMHRIPVQREMEPDQGEPRS